MADRSWLLLLFLVSSACSGVAYATLHTREGSSTAENSDDDSIAHDDSESPRNVPLPLHHAGESGSAFLRSPERDVCVISCANGGQPKDDCSGCECRNGWTSVFCEVCPICMHGGTPKEDCSACECPKPFVGRYCHDVDESHGPQLFLGVFGRVDKSTLKPITSPYRDEASYYIGHLPRIFIDERGHSYRAAPDFSDEIEDFPLLPKESEYEEMGYQTIDYDVETVSKLIKDIGGELREFYYPGYCEVVLDAAAFRSVITMEVFDFIALKPPKTKIDPLIVTKDHYDKNTVGGDVHSKEEVDEDTWQTMLALISEKMGETGSGGTASADSSAGDGSTDDTPSSEDMLLRVSAVEDFDLTSLHADLELVEMDNRFSYVFAPRDKLMEIATALSASPSVAGVDLIQRPQPAMKSANWVVQSNVENSTPLHDMGITGRGQTVYVSDWAPDHDTCMLGAATVNDGELWVRVDSVTLHDPDEDPRRVRLNIHLETYQSYHRVTKRVKMPRAGRYEDTFVVQDRDMNDVEVFALEVGRDRYRLDHLLPKIIVGQREHFTIGGTASTATVTGSVLLKESQSNSKITRYFSKGLPIFRSAKPYSASHGTHVSGTVAGNCPSGGAVLNQYRGVAYHSKLVVFNMQSGRQVTVSNYKRFDLGYQSGAKISTNSYGVDDVSIMGLYKAEAQDADRFAYEHRDYLILYAAGNDGDPGNKKPDGHQTMGTEGTLKNGLAIGATKMAPDAWKGIWRFKPNYDEVCWKSRPAVGETCGTMGVDPVEFSHDIIAAFSSRGPIGDRARIKPDLMAPGQLVSTALKTTLHRDELYRPKHMHCCGSQFSKSVLYHGAGVYNAKGGGMLFDGESKRWIESLEFDGRGLVQLEFSAALTSRDRRPKTEYLKCTYTVNGGRTYHDCERDTYMDIGNTRKRDFRFYVGPETTADSRSQMRFRLSQHTPDDSFRDRERGIIIYDFDVTVTRHPVDPSYHQLTFMEGTSMSTPVVAGAAALVRQAYEDGFYPGGVAKPYMEFNPSASLVKATLVASAVPMNLGDDWLPGRPGFAQGFGRINLSTVLIGGGTTIPHTGDTFINLGEKHRYLFKVTKKTTLRAVLAWTDPPGTSLETATDQRIQHDLDLTMQRVKVEKDHDGHIVGYEKLGLASMGNAQLRSASLPKGMEAIPLERVKANNNVEVIEDDGRWLNADTYIRMSVKFRQSFDGRMDQEYSLLVHGDGLVPAYTEFVAVIFKLNYQSGRMCHVLTPDGKLINARQVCPFKTNEMRLISPVHVGDSFQLTFRERFSEYTTDFYLRKTKLYNTNTGKWLAVREPCKEEFVREYVAITCTFETVSGELSTGNGLTKYEVSVWSHPNTAARQQLAGKAVWFTGRITGRDSSGKEQKVPIRLRIESNEHPHGQMTLSWMSTEAVPVLSQIDTVSMAVEGPWDGPPWEVNRVVVHDVKRRRTYETRLDPAERLTVTRIAHQLFEIGGTKGVAIDRGLQSEILQECLNSCQHHRKTPVPDDAVTRTDIQWFEEFLIESCQKGCVENPEGTLDCDAYEGYGYKPAWNEGCKSMGSQISMHEATTVKKAAPVITEGRRAVMRGETERRSRKE